MYAVKQIKSYMMAISLHFVGSDSSLRRFMIQASNVEFHEPLKLQDRVMHSYAYWENCMNVLLRSRLVIDEVTSHKDFSVFFRKIRNRQLYFSDFVILDDPCVHPF